MFVLLEKNYQLTPKVIHDGCRLYSKKFPDKAMWIKISIMLILAIATVAVVIFVPMGNMQIIPLLVCVILIAFALKESDKRRRLIFAIEENSYVMQDETYSIRITESNVEISTLSKDDGEEAPEPSVYPRDDNLEIIENEDLFLLVYANEIFYIIPKKFFNEDECSVIRSLKLNCN